MGIQRINVVGVPVDVCRPEDLETEILELLAKPGTKQIVFLNIWGLLKARRKNDFAECVKNADLIIPISKSILNGAKFLKKEIPVIYTAVSDPEAAGLAEDGMNVTGTSDLLPLKEQVAMIRELMPEAKNLGVLYCTSEANSISNIARLEQIAPEYGFTLVTKGVSAPADIPMATDAILNEVDCLTNLTDNTIVNSLAVVMDKANAKGIPVFGSEVEQVKLGCAAAANIDYYKLGIMTGKMAADVLNGTDITTIPFEVIEDNELVVNSEVLEKYGLVIPAGVEVTEAADITNEA